MPKEILKRGATSNIIRVFLQDSASTTGAGKTALTSTSSGLIISTIADLEATATTYTSAATNVETITTLGTFAAPTASKCRFREVDATNFPGVYEIQIADARFAVANSTQLLISIQCTGVAPVYVEYQLVAVDLMDAVRFGITALPNFNAGVIGGLPLSINTAGAVNTVQINGTNQTARDIGASVLLSSGTGTGQISLSSGLVTLAGVTHTNAVIPTVTTVTNNVGVGSIANNVITTASINDNAITSAKITDGTLTAAKFGDSALVIGSGAAGGVKAYLAAGSVTAGVIATDAIDADAIANSAITIRMSGDGTPSEGRIIAGSIASDVWNAATASYTTAGTFGKLMDTLKKANFVIEGTTTAGSTTTSVNTNLTGYVTNAFEQQTVLFISGTLAGSCGLVSASSTGGGVLTIDEALPGAPASGVDFVILGTHVHTKSSIANTTWTYDISAVSTPGTAGLFLTDTNVDTGNILSSVTTIEAVAYRQSIADYLLGRNLAGGSDGGRTVKDALRALRNKSEIVGATLTVYQENDTTSAWTATVSSSASADPVTGIDPA